MSKAELAGSSGKAVHITPWRVTGYVLLASYAVVMLVTVGDYGITWDEFQHGRYGDEIVRWYESGFRDRSATTHRLYLYLGGLFDVTASFIARTLSVELFSTRHVLGAFSALVGAIYTFRSADLLAGPRAGVFAVSSIILLPSYYGHAFNNPKDIPFAATYMASLFYILQAERTLPRIPPRIIAALGLAIGLALGTRVAAASLLFYLALAFILWSASRRLALQERLEGVGWWRAAAAFLPRFAMVAVMAYVVMLLFWPAAQLRPISHVIQTLEVTRNYQWNLPVLFEGIVVRAQELPSYYLLKWVLISLPEFYFIAIAAVALTLAALLRRGTLRAFVDDRHVGYALLAAAAVMPPAIQILGHSAIYDAWRHFLFIGPPMAVLAGCALSNALSLKERGWRRAGFGLVAGAMLSAAITVADMIRLHPYQTVYFNRAIAGGVARAAKSYETDYWGNSYKEGAEWLQATYTPGPGKEHFRISSCPHFFSTSYFLRDPAFEYAGAPWELTATPDFFLATTRFDCHRRIPGRVVFVVQRIGAPLLYVKDVRQNPPPT